MFKYLAFFLAMAAPVQANPHRFRQESNPDVATHSLVEVTETCVDKQQEIVIHFRNSKRPEFDDWVGIYPKDYKTIDEPLHWVS